MVFQHKYTIMSAPFYYNSDLSTSLIVVFQFVFFVLRESFREEPPPDDLDRRPDQVVANGAALSLSDGATQYRVPTVVQRRQSKAQVVRRHGGGVAGVRLAVPLIVVEDCSDVAVMNRGGCNTHLCPSCMQLKVKEMDDRVADVVVRHRNPQSKRRDWTSHSVLFIVAK